MKWIRDARVITTHPSRGRRQISINSRDRAFCRLFNFNVFSPGTGGRVMRFSAQLGDVAGVCGPNICTLGATEVPGARIRGDRQFALATGRSTNSTLLRARDEPEMFRKPKVRAQSRASKSRARDPEAARRLNRFRCDKLIIWIPRFSTSGLLDDRKSSLGIGAKIE